MMLYHNSAACCNTVKKSGGKSTSKSRSTRKSASKSANKNKRKKTSKSTKKNTSKTRKKNPVKKGYKCTRKTKHCVISPKAPNPPGRKKPVRAPSEKISKKNQRFLEGLGLKVKDSVGER